MEVLIKNVCWSSVVIGTILTTVPGVIQPTLGEDLNSTNLFDNQTTQLSISTTFEFEPPAARLNSTQWQLESSLAFEQIGTQSLADNFEEKSSNQINFDYLTIVESTFVEEISANLPTNQTTIIQGAKYLTQLDFPSEEQTPPPIIETEPEPIPDDQPTPDEELDQPSQTTPETEPEPEDDQPTLDEELDQPPQTTPEPEPTPDNQPTPIEPTQQPTQTEPRVLVAEIAVEGVEGELEDLVYETITTRPGRTTTRSQLQQDLNAIYATGFFSDVTARPVDTPLGVRITYVVEPNPVLNDVVIQTLPPGTETQVIPPEVVDEIFEPQYGEILNLQELQENIIEINEWYSERGYDLAQVVGAPQISEDGTVTLQIAEGIIEDIQVRYFDEDNELTEGATREFIITRELQLESGEVFNRETAQEDLRRVFGLGIFEDVRLSFEPGTNPSQVILNLDVVEGSTGSFAAGAGFSSASGLFGTASYQQRNLGGNNQTLAAEIQIGTGAQRFLFDVSFTDPWIAGDPYRTSYTINAFRRRSISLVFDGDEEDIETEDGDDSPRIVRTGGGIRFSRPIPADPFANPDWRLSTGFQYQRVRVENDDGDLSPFAEEDDGGGPLSFSDSGQDDLFIFNFGAVRDRRDSILQPTEGSFVRLGVDQTVPIGSGSILFTRLRGSYSYYIPVDWITFSEGPQTLAFNVQGGTLFGDLPPYEAFVIGGSNSVRGYGEGELGNGRAFVQATAEYRFPVFSVVGGALFVDFGSTLGTGDEVPGEPAEVRDLPGTGFGYGVGVRIQSPLGPIRVDYGINSDGENEIHFGIGERF